MCTQIAINMAMTSPVRRLPAEVLALIFDAMLEENDAFQRPTIAAGTVMGVCHSWFLVVRGMSHIWRNLCGGCPDRHHDHSLERMHHMAGLAQSRLLRMRWLAASALEDLGRILMEYTARLEHLELRCSWYELASLSVIELPLLKSIDVGLHGPANPFPLKIISGAPLLTRLTVYALPPYGGSDDGNDSIVRSFPFFHKSSQMLRFTHVSLSLSISPLLSSVIQLLHDCRGSLIKLKLSGDVTMDREPGSDPSIVMEVLEGMDLGWEACQLTRVIAAPSLCTLALRDCVVEDEDGGCKPGNVWTTVLGLFQDEDHIPSLKRLDLQRVDLAFPDSSADFDSVANVTMGLRELHIDNSDKSFSLPQTYDCMFTRLQCCHSLTPCFPCLSHLTVLLGDRASDEVTASIYHGVLRCRDKQHVCASKIITQLEHIMTDIQ
ncbi:hypothetical protein K523DRAFT_248473 [Schizophyllum commune Tattone D]|nr:hypothetical protein K523DRAFT_248473 [Schizophyllum commune Tattone D]